MTQQALKPMGQAQLCPAAPGLHGGHVAWPAARAAGPSGGYGGPLPPQKQVMCLVLHQQLSTPRHVPVSAGLPCLRVRLFVPLVLRSTIQVFHGKVDFSVLNNHSFTTG